MSDLIRERVNEASVNGQLSCAQAHRLALELGVTPLEIGRLVNRDTSLRFYRCQLGLFGYGEKAEGTHRIVQPAAHVPPEVEDALRARVREGRISCLDVWEVADALEYPRLAMANIVEALGLRIKPCQLGCF